MKLLTLAELQTVLARHTFLRMENIPLETGLLVDNRYLLMPTAEGDLKGIDTEGIHDLYYYGTDKY